MSEWRYWLQAAISFLMVTGWLRALYWRRQTETAKRWLWRLHLRHRLPDTESALEELGEFVFHPPPCPPGPPGHVRIYPDPMPTRGGRDVLSP